MMRCAGSLSGGVARQVAFRMRTACIGVVCILGPLSLPAVATLLRNEVLVGVTGHWTASDDSGPTLTVDGTRWSGTTPPASLSTLSTQLFGGVDSMFVRNGQAVGAFPVAIAPAVPRVQHR